jgi:hypothetical protein
VLRAALWLIAAVIALGIVATVIGWWLPVQHVASRSATFAAAPEELYRVVSDVAAYREWLDDSTPVQVVDAVPPQRFITRVVDPDGQFGGTWTFDIAPDASGSRLTITEHGEVYNPLFRFMSRFVFGHTATMDRYLAALAARSGAQAP